MNNLFCLFFCGKGLQEKASLHIKLFILFLFRWGDKLSGCKPGSWHSLAHWLSSNGDGIKSGRHST